MNQAFTFYNKKGQTSLIDFLVAFLIIVSTLLYVSIQYYSNTKQETNLYDEALKVSNQLLSEGIPKNWNETNVKYIGLIENSSLSLSKINKARALPYNILKRKIGLNYNYDFLVIFKEGDQIINELGCGLGPSSIDLCNFNGMPPTINYENLAKVVRLSDYNNTPITLIIYVWD